MCIYLVKVYLHDHNSFIGIVNFCQLNLYRSRARGKLSRSPPLSAPLVTAVTSNPVYSWPLWYRSSLWRWLSFMTDVRYNSWTRITWVVSVRVGWGSGGRIFSGVILSAYNFSSCCYGCSSCSRSSVPPYSLSVLKNIFSALVLSTYLSRIH